MDELIIGLAVAPLFIPSNRVDPLILRTAPAAVAFLYFVLFEHGTGRTPGKLSLGLSVSSIEGGSVSLRQAAIRNVWIFFRLIPGAGLFFMLAVSLCIALTISSDPRRRGIHDRMAGSVVTRVG